MSFFKEISSIVNVVKRIYAHNRLLTKLRDKKTIILIAGHHRLSLTHSEDTGAVANEAVEHYECEILVDKASKILSNDGYNVIVCPFNLNLTEKINWLNKYFPADSVVISVHLNGFRDVKASGSEVWIHNNEERKFSMAGKISETLSRTLETKNRGVKVDSTCRFGMLGILRTKVMDSFLLELGFITNKEDLEKVRNKGATAVAYASSLAWNYDIQKF